MKNPSYLVVLSVPALLLLIPAIAMRFTNEVVWTASDFIIMYALMAGVGLAYKFVTSRSVSVAYRAASAIALGAAFLLVWVNLAVGFIGSEDNPANALFLGVLLTGLIGAAISRFRPQGMAVALYAMAGVQFLVPVVAYAVWRPNFDVNVAKIFVLNFAWVLAFASAGVLYRRSGAADEPPHRLHA